MVEVIAFESSASFTHFCRIQLGEVQVHMTFILNFCLCIIDIAV